jgi:hypothetical protein
MMMMVMVMMMVVVCAYPIVCAPTTEVTIIPRQIPSDKKLCH